MRTRTPTETLVAPPERLTDRVVVHLRPRRLDVALANGTPPETNAALALRARRLTRVSSRRELARSIRRLLGADGARPTGVRPIWGRVAAAADELLRLADSLAQPNPVTARGVAQARLLLTDGTGPLYNPRSSVSVRDRAADAVEYLSRI